MNDSFNLDAQLRQIKEQAERDGVEIVKVFSDSAQSAYREKNRPGTRVHAVAGRQAISMLVMRLVWPGRGLKSINFRINRLISPLVFSILVRVPASLPTIAAALLLGIRPPRGAFATFPLQIPLAWSV